jgi:hypothetical protein
MTRDNMQIVNLEKPVLIVTLKYPVINNFQNYKSDWNSDIFLECGETESTWYVVHYLAYSTSPGWWIMMSVKQTVEWLDDWQEKL